MKKIVFFLLFNLAFNLGFSQSLKINKVDEFTGKKVKVTNIIAAGTSKNQSKLGIIFDNVEGKFSISLFSPENLGCSGAIKNYAIILFTDDSKIFLNKDKSDINCGNHPYSTYRLTEDQLMKLQIKNIKGIRLGMSKSSDDFFTDPATAIKIKKMAMIVE